MNTLLDLFRTLLHAGFAPSSFFATLVWLMRETGELDSEKYVGNPLYKWYFSVGLVMFVTAALGMYCLKNVASNTLLWAGVIGVITGVTWFGTRLMYIRKAFGNVLFYWQLPIIYTLSIGFGLGFAAWVYILAGVAQVSVVVTFTMISFKFLVGLPLTWIDSELPPGENVRGTGDL